MIKVLDFAILKIQDAIELVLRKRYEIAAVTWAEAYLAWAKYPALDHDDCSDPCPACEEEQPLSDSADDAREKFEEARLRLLRYREKDVVDG